VTDERFVLVAKNEYFSPLNGDEIQARRQKWAFFTLKRRRDSGSSPKTSIFHLKTVTRFRLVAKNKHFSPQSGDEIQARRQKWAFFTLKRRRDSGSSPKTGIFHLKTVTRFRLVAKKSSFSHKYDDEIQARRQKQAFFTLKRRRDSGSSPKKCVFHRKMVTRLRFVVKKVRFSP